MKLSIDGYKRNSKDKNNPYNIIPSGDITMEGVDFPVMGTDNLGNQQLMQPGFNYKFPGNMVFEQPVQEKPKNQVKNRRIDRDNKLLPNWTKGMGDVSSHLMTTIEMTDDDGSPIYIAIPMLYPVVEGQETPDPTTWKEFKTGEEEDAFKMALERGEVYYFNSAEEADEFAKGGYKTPNLKKKKYGGQLPKAQWWNPAKAYRAVRGVKDLFSKKPSIPSTGPKLDLEYPTGLTHRFTNKDNALKLGSEEYKTFPEWQNYIAAFQPNQAAYQLPTIINDPGFNNLVNNKGLINTNALNSYINKTKGLNNIELYDREKLKSLYESLDLKNQKFVDKDLFLTEASKLATPQPIFPSLKSIPMGSNTEFVDYWEGENNPLEISATNPHVLQTYLPTSLGVPMWDRSVGSSHFKPLENPKITKKIGNVTYTRDPEGLGGLTLGHSRVAFSPHYPNTTIEIERQSDYAQRFNLKQKADASNPLGLNERDQYIHKLKTGDDDIVPNTGLLDRHKEFMVEFNAMSDKDIANSLTRRAIGENPSAPLVRNLSRYYMNNRSHGSKGFNELTDDQLFTMAKNPAFKNYLKTGENQLKKEYDQSVLNFEDLKETQKTELYNVENPNELSLNLKDYRKNAPAILLSELVDYSTKLGNTHLHIPLAETVAKTQGYNADKFHAPNPLYHKHKWTGHSWNDFNSLIENSFGNLVRSSVPSKETFGPFTFEKNKNGVVSATYKKPDGSIIDILGDSKKNWLPNQFGDKITEIEKIRNEFLKDQGYNPLVDFKSQTEAYKPEHQTILNKSTEKQIKKNIETLFGKNYPYEIITDVYNNKYIRLDHTGTRLPIKGLDKYKYGGSLPKAQYNFSLDTTNNPGLINFIKQTNKIRKNPLIKYDKNGNIVMPDGVRQFNRNDFFKMRQEGGSLPKAQLQLTKYYDEIANLLGKADDFKSLLPSPTVSTLPYQKLLTFDQTGQVIPQQHMVNSNRGAASLNDALNDLYSGEPMWFAPVGDTRYFNNSLESFGKLNEDALDFLPGAGRPIIRYIRDQKGNTGKWGFNEYPLTEAEKLTKRNLGFWDVEKTQPIMRTEQITKPDFQSKIIGDFAPDIKFKIFEDFDLSRKGHAMHKVWTPEELQLIKDEGFDAIQLVKDGIQIENILLNPDKFKIRSINEMPVHIDNPPFATGGTLPKAQLQNLPKIWNTGKSILQRPWNINTWIPNTGHISGLNIGATSASNYSANALKNLENITRIKDQELLNSITNNYSKILSGDIDAQNNLEQFARLNPDALITLGQSDNPYLNAIMNRNKNISIGSWAGENKDIGASGSELFKNMSSYNPDGLLIENIPTLSGGTTSLTMGPNTMPTVDPIYNLFTPAKGAGAWQGSNQHTYLMNQTSGNPSLILSGDKGFVSRGNDDGWFSGRWLTRNVGPNRLNANWDSNYGIRGTTGQSILDKVSLLDEQFNLDKPLEGTFMQFYNPPEKTYGNIGNTSIETEIIGKDFKRNGGSLPKHQIKEIVKYGDDAIDGLNLLNKNIKSVFLFDKTKPLTLMDDLGYRIKPNTLKEITNRQDLIKQYNLRNNQYRTVNINDGVLNNEQLISGAKIAGYNPYAADELAAYMGTTPTLGLGRRAGFEGTQRNISDILYTGDFPHITEGRYRTGNPKNTWTVKSNLWEDDIASLSDQQLFDRITLLDNSWSADAAHNIYNVGDLAKFKSMSDINAPHGSILNTLSTKVPNLLQTNMIYGNAFEPVRKPLGLIRSDDLNRSLKLSGNKFDTFKEGGSIKDRYNKKLSKFQLEGENNPGWLAKRLYNSVTPIGYNIDQAMVEMLHGEKQPFMWDGVETSFADFQNHPRFKDNLQLGEYIKNASEDLWGMYLGFDQKHNTVSKSKFKPTLGIENDETTYYSFNNVDDIMDDIIERGITQDITNDEWQIEDSAAGGFNLNNYQLSRGMDDEKELPYISYYDEYDFDIPTGLGFNIEGESIVGKPFDIYGRIYYNPETNELIHPSELNANWVDFEKLKQGIAYAESLNGELMINPESTATGLYGQRFSEIKDMYNGTREDFAKDIDAQNEFFENRYRDNLEGVKALRQSGIDLYKKYSSQIPNFPYSTTEVAALVNFLGRQGAREYFGYVLREGNTLESVFPDKYGPNAQQANKTPQEYIEKFNEGIIKKKMGGEVDKLTDRLIKKYEEGGKLTPAGTKHLKSLGMI